MKYSRTIVLFLMTILSNPAYSQSDTLNRPYLNGHRFIVNEFVNDPFLYTSFNLNMGYGSSSGYDFPVVTIGDYELNISSGELFFGTLHAGYSQQINDWSMAFVNIGVTGRFGAEPTSLLTQGLNSLTGISYGMRFNVFRSKKSMITSEFRVKNYGISFINVFKYLKDLIEQNPGADLTENAHLLSGHIGLNYAYAHNDLWGFYSTVKYFFGDSIIPGNSVSELNLEFAFDLNLADRT